MKITEVRIFPTESKDGKLKAFATMTFDDWFVVRNVKVIQGNSGLFVAMPSRKAVEACGKCRFKNVVGSKYCNQCGSEQKPQVFATGAENEKYNSHMDIAHPITQECRVYIQEQILKAYSENSAPALKSEKAEEKTETVLSAPGEAPAKAEEKNLFTEPTEPVPPAVDVVPETIDVSDGKDIEL